MPFEAPTNADRPPLWPALWRSAPDMHFFRFCELLERSAPDRPGLGTTDSPADDPVRFRSRQEVGFPGREIDAVEHDTDPSRPPTVRTTFLGLYGVDARMPAYFIDTIAQGHEGADALAAFLDMFHHRIVTQYYRLWRKYRYPVGFASGGSDPTSRYLLSLAGLGWAETSESHAVETRQMLAMLGLTQQKTRTAEGLRGILQPAVPDATITVQACHPVWVALEDADPMPLGEHCVLGGGFIDRSQCVRVIIAPTLASSVEDLMPGQPMHTSLMHLLRFYLGYEAQAVIDMHVAPELMPAPSLGDTRLSLGYNALLPTDNASSAATAPVCVSLAVWGMPAR